MISISGGQPSPIGRSQKLPPDLREKFVKKFKIDFGE
jgi:hypothetical protein